MKVRKVEIAGGGGYTKHHYNPIPIARDDMRLCYSPGRCEDEKGERGYKKDVVQVIAALSIVTLMGSPLAWPSLVRPFLVRKPRSQIAFPWF